LAEDLFIKQKIVAYRTQVQGLLRSIELLLSIQPFILKRWAHPSPETPCWSSGMSHLFEMFLASRTMTKAPFRNDYGLRHCQYETTTLSMFIANRTKKLLFMICFPQH